MRMSTLPSSPLSATCKVPYNGVTYMALGYLAIWLPFKLNKWYCVIHSLSR